RAAFGISENEKRRRIAIRAAERTAAHCARCERPLAPNEPVWRSPVFTGRGIFGGWCSTTAPQCESCKPKGRVFWNPQSCQQCGRPVHNGLNRRRYLRTFCSSFCRQQFAVREARERRRRATQVCPTCGEVFEPPRADAKFCSSRCRQRAYRRRRVTDI